MTARCQVLHLVFLRPDSLWRFIADEQFKMSCAYPKADTTLWTHTRWTGDKGNGNSRQQSFLFSPHIITIIIIHINRLIHNFPSKYFKTFSLFLHTFPVSNLSNYEFENYFPIPMFLSCKELQSICLPSLLIPSKSEKPGRHFGVSQCKCLFYWFWQVTNSYWVVLLFLWP